METESIEEESAEYLAHRGGALPGVVVVFSCGRPVCRVLPLSRGAVGIGRAELDAAGVPDAKVSGRHVRVTREDGRFGVRDLDSKNGTFVDGRPVQAGRQLSAPVLRIGRTILLPVPDCRPFAEVGVEVAGGVVRGPRLRAVHDRASAVARSGASLLVLGESGSGKELCAQAFHAAGAGAGRPLVAINCATIPRELAERTLFGARRGAYTGAVADADGLVQAADGGTLFLDEIAELEPAVQAKLLRVLETKEVTPLGGLKPAAVDVRVCAATHKNLRAEVVAGRFREDLYFRVGRPELRLPPLRERREEIPFLVERALERLPGGAEVAASVELVEACLLRPWPGNVRELLAEARSAAVVAATVGRGVVAAADLLRGRGRGARGRRRGGRSGRARRIAAPGTGRDRGGAPGRARQRRPGRRPPRHVAEPAPALHRAGGDRPLVAPRLSKSSARAALRGRRVEGHDEVVQRRGHVPPVGEPCRLAERPRFARAVEVGREAVLALLVLVDPAARAGARDQDDEATPRRDVPGQGGERRRRGLDPLQHPQAEHPVEGAPERQRLDVALLAARDVSPCALHHFGREIHRPDLVAPGVERPRVVPGPATCVEHRSAAGHVELLVDQPRLAGAHPREPAIVCRVAIRRRPLSVVLLDQIFLRAQWLSQERNRGGHSRRSDAAWPAVSPTGGRDAPASVTGDLLRARRSDAGMAEPARSRQTRIMVRRRSLLVSLAAFAFAAATALTSFAFAPRHASNLFVILRSKNADEAHYDARMTRDGALDNNDPVDGYFMNLDPQGKWYREDFTWFQKRAYGWDTSSTGNGTYALKLKAFNDRPMWVVKANGRWRVQTTVAGKQAYLDHLYVATDESGIMPKVLYVDIFGEDAASGAALTEHLLNK